MREEIFLQMQDDGSLLLSREGRSRLLSFNEIYKDYYPFCRWTAVGKGELLYLAGTDQKNMPHLFSSTTGDVWAETNIKSRYGLPDPAEYGDILRVLYDEKKRQIFLVTANGYLVTLPDCPSCVRARHVTDGELTDGLLENDTILLTGAKGDILRIPVDIEAQYRCSWEFAKPFLAKGGLLIDLRGRDEQRDLPIPAAIRAEPGDLDGLLRQMPKRRPLIFFCDRGYLADQAVREARDAGFERAYSLGGIYEFLPVEKEV